MVLYLIIKGLRINNMGNKIKTFKELGFDNFLNRGLNLPRRKTETRTGMEQQDQSISLNELTVGKLTGGTIQTHTGKHKGVKIIGATGIDFYGVSSRFLDTSGNSGGIITGIDSGGIHLYSTTGTVKINSGNHQLNLIYDTMRWDKTPDAESITTASHYVLVNMNGTNFKLLLKSI